MTIAERALHDGRWLFGARSVVPLFLTPLLLLAMPEAKRLQDRLGSGGSTVVQCVALAIALAGVLLRCATVAFSPDGTSARDTRRLRASALNVRGMYSLIRHPLYLGSGMIWVGVAASMCVWWLVVIVSLTYGLYVERLMMVEEAFLCATFQEDFRQWAAATPAFVPRRLRWLAPDGGCQWRRVLSEHNALLGVAVAFTLLPMIGHLAAGEPLISWLGDHSARLYWLAAAVVVSTFSIMARRLPRRPENSAVANDVRT